MHRTIELLSASPQRFVEWLKTEGIRRFYFVLDKPGDKLAASHPSLQPVADFIASDSRDFLQHEGMFFQLSESCDTLHGAFVHKTVRGHAAGGVRYWHYECLEDYLRDGLRLAKGMTRKNALAGLWWGGGKGVMWHNPQVDKHDPETRKTLYREYGELMTSIKGCYITAEDAGTGPEDMANIFATTRFTTCIPEELGGSGNPSVPTARGVVRGMEAALHFAGEETLAGKTVFVQGLGNVGRPLLQFLLEKDVARITGVDINRANVEQATDQFQTEKMQVRLVSPGDVSCLASECDVLAPCATGAILNPATIEKIQARIVCGAANNQLEDTVRDDRLLAGRGILYVPDFLTNRMGIVNCANEQYGYVADDPLIERHLSSDWEYSIYKTTLRVLEKAYESGQPPAQVAIEFADTMSNQPHPIFGHRGQQIIESLVAERWHEGFGAR